MELTLQEKLKLIDFFEFLLDKEVSKPLGEMNSEAVDNYIKILLHLQDKHVDLSSDFINEQVRKIFSTEDKKVAPETAQTTKKRYSKKKIWIIAACIAILVALFSIISFSSEKGVAETLENFFGVFDFIPYGNEIIVDGETYRKDGSAKMYKSPEELAKGEKMDILYPQNIPADIDHISVGIVDDVEMININYIDSDLYITISTDAEIPQETKDICNDKITINEIEYYLCIMEDVNMFQAYFIYDNNLYEIVHKDKEEFMKILNNMDEIKNEN